MLTRDEARRRISEALREESIASKRADIARLQRDVDRDLAMDPERCVRYFFPFGDTPLPSGALDVRAGLAIWTATEAAQALADMTGQPVSFVFNERLATVRPGEAAKAYK